MPTDAFHFSSHTQPSLFVCVCVLVCVVRAVPVWADWPGELLHPTGLLQSVRVVWCHYSVLHRRLSAIVWLLHRHCLGFTLCVILAVSVYVRVSSVAFARCFHCCHSPVRLCAMPVPLGLVLSRAALPTRTTSPSSSATDQRGSVRLLALVVPACPHWTVPTISLCRLVSCRLHSRTSTPPDFRKRTFTPLPRFLRDSVDPGLVGFRAQRLSAAVRADFVGLPAPTAALAVSRRLVYVPASPVLRPGAPFLSRRRRYSAVPPLTFVVATELCSRLCCLWVPSCLHFAPSSSTVATAIATHRTCPRVRRAATVPVTAVHASRRLTLPPAQKTTCMR